MYIKGLGGIKHWHTGDSRMNSKDWTVGEGQKCVGSVQKKVAGLAVGSIDETV